MSDDRDAECPTRGELIDLWSKAFGEPPPIIHDPRLMLELVVEALRERCDD